MAGKAALSMLIGTEPATCAYNEQHEAIRLKGPSMNFHDLNPELQEKVKACTTPDEILSLATEEGYELSDAELEQISGGDFWDMDWEWCTEQGPCNRWFPK